MSRLRNAVVPPPFEELVEALVRSEAYPLPVGPVERLHTHISVVFLAGDRVYKVKRPKDLGFLDFTTAERRRHFCHEEVRLNRRLAPRVYEGVVPVLLQGGIPRFSDELDRDPRADPDDGVVDWAVRMVRLPADRTFKALLGAGRIEVGDVRRLADRIARFHRTAEAGPEIASLGGWATVWGNDRENFEQIRSFIGRTITPGVHQRLEELAARELAGLRPLIEERARSGAPRDTHGDLRLEHVYLLPPGAPGTEGEGDDELVIIDCIEFNERFRWADPVADLAFLVMELEFEGRPELAAALADRYFATTGEEDAARLLPYYTAYRDIVRGKVRSLQAADPQLPEDLRREAARKATRHFLLALGRLASPSERPALVLLSGLPGIGKSTLARELARTEGFEWIDTDRVRKELARAEGVEGGGAGEAFGHGIYAPEWTERTYRECARRARGVLLGGGRVLVEGSFAKEAHRVLLLDLARELGVPGVLLRCEVSEHEARRRIQARSAEPRADEPSDADWRIHREMAVRWEEPGDEIEGRLRLLRLEGGAAETTLRARQALAKEGLAEEPECGEAFRPDTV